MLFSENSRDARCYSDEATKEMITRYAVVVWDGISIISFLQARVRDPWKTYDRAHETCQASINARHAGCLPISESARAVSDFPGSARGQVDAPDGCGSGMTSTLSLPR